MGVVHRSLPPLVYSVMYERTRQYDVCAKVFDNEWTVMECMCVTDERRNVIMFTPASQEPSVGQGPHGAIEGISLIDV